MNEDLYTEPDREEVARAVLQSFKVGAQLMRSSVGNNDTPIPHSPVYHVYEERTTSLHKGEKMALPMQSVWYSGFPLINEEPRGQPFSTLYDYVLWFS